MEQNSHGSKSSSASSPSGMKRGCEGVRGVRSERKKGDERGVSGGGREYDTSITQTIKHHDDLETSCL